MTYNDETDEWVTISEDSYDHEGGIDQAQNYGGFIAQAAEAERNRQTQSRQIKDQLLFNQQSVDLAKDKWQTQKDIKQGRLSLWKTDAPFKPSIIGAENRDIYTDKNVLSTGFTQLSIILHNSLR